MSRRRIIQSQIGELPKLPNGYVRCKYLESSGNQYINTLIKPIVSTYVRPIISIKVDVANFNIKQRIFGVSVPSRDIFFQLFINTSETTNFGFQAFNTNDYTKFDMYQKEHNYLFDFEKRKAYQDDSEKELNFSNGKVDLCLFLFSRNTDNIADSYFMGKIYSFSYKDETQNIELVPAVDPTGKPCMFDTVTKQQIYNSGNGEFGYELMDGTYVAPV